MMTSDSPAPEADDPVDKLPFEDALGRLEEIVHSLEVGADGLEESMRQFEAGVSLLRRCHALLEQAEQRIEILTGRDEAGNPVTEPFDASSSVETGKRKSSRPKGKGKKSTAGSDEAECADDPDTRLF